MTSRHIVRKEPLLDSSRSLRYFITDEEYRSLPENTQIIFLNLPKNLWFCLLAIFYTFQQFFFLASVKAGKQYGMLIGILIMFFLCIQSLFLSFKSSSTPERHHYGSLIFIGLLDILYILAMTPAVANTPALAASVYIQGSIVIKLILMVWLSGHSFRNSHYVGAILISGSIVTNCVIYGDMNSVILIAALAISAVSQMFKIKYVRKHICNSRNFNKYTLLFATILGFILTPLFLLIAGDDIGIYLISGLECIFEIECSGLLIYLIGLLICASIYHAILYRVRGI